MAVPTLSGPNGMVNAFGRRTGGLLASWLPAAPMEGSRALSSILWAIIVLLVIFWLFGAFVANLGDIVWLALVVAVILLIYNLLTRGRAEI